MSPAPHPPPRRAIWWLASYPKSGNTWLRAWLRNLQLDQDTPADINDLQLGPFAGSREWFEDVLGLDSHDLTPDLIRRQRPRLHLWAAAQAETPLFCKTHDQQEWVAEEALWLFPPEASLGVLYLVRNPLDVAVSLAAHMGCDLDEAIHRLNSPGHAISALPGDSQLRQHLGDWSGHVAAWTEQDKLPVLTLRYEDMVRAPRETLARVTGFLAWPSTPAQRERALRHADFQVLRAQEQERGFEEASTRSAGFFRRGQPDAWREALSPAQVRRLVSRHQATMARFGYLDAAGHPV